MGRDPIRGLVTIRDHWSDLDESEKYVCHDTFPNIRVIEKYVNEALWLYSRGKTKKV